MLTVLLGRVPHDILDIGEPNSKFRVILPRLNAAQTAASISSKRSDDPAGKAIVAMWENIASNMSSLKEMGFHSEVYEGILCDAAEKEKTMRAIISCEYF